MDLKGKTQQEDGKVTKEQLHNLYSSLGRVSKEGREMQSNFSSKT
jgi:hypothetical protein